MLSFRNLKKANTLTNKFFFAFIKGCKKTKGESNVVTPE